MLENSIYTFLTSDELINTLKTLLRTNIYQHTIVAKKRFTAHLKNTVFIAELAVYYSVHIRRSKQKPQMFRNLTPLLNILLKKIYTQKDL